MCGIVGLKKFIEPPKDNDINRVKKGLSIQRHRGPDNTSFEVIGRSVLGHNRLAIIDLNERANQPLRDKTGRYSIVFNGEIYNYPELKKDLLNKKYVFETSSDTEVLLYHIIENGTAGIAYLEGSFAFSFYDSQEDEMLLVRDHLGIKPLLFSIQEDELLFASELTSFKYLLKESIINKSALNAYFQYTYVPAPDTMIVGVHKLLPGNYLKIKGKNIDVLEYYSVRNAPKIDMPYDEALKEVKKKVEHAVIKRLNADVPIGTFLSGGLDSSIVSQITADFKTSVSTFSIGFLGNDFLDETSYAQKVAEHIGSSHYPIQLDKGNVVLSFQEIMAAYDEPFADSSAVAMYFLSRAAKEKVTVCLSGDGADELFAGYNKHKAYIRSKHPTIFLKVATKIAGQFSGGNRRGKFSNKIRQLKKFAVLLQQKWPNSYWILAEFISKKRRDDLLLESSRYKCKVEPGQESLKNFLMTDQQFVLPNDMLKKVDLMSMRNALEVRTPFLDKDLVDFVNGLPDEYKLTNGIGKKILRDAFKGALPDEIFKRSKKGFEIPLKEWIESVWDNVVNEEWFSKDYIEKQNLFSKNGVDQLKADFEKGEEEEATVVMWAYLVFQSWLERWIEK